VGRVVSKLIIHCSYTPPSMDIGAAEIRQWHTSPDPNDPSKPWRDIGYHWVIRRRGGIEPGRREAVAGAHTRGQNATSIGVCLVGGMAEGDRRPECNFTGAQYDALCKLIRQIRSRYPNIEISGHSDWDRGRACPTFNAKEFVACL